MSSAPAPRSNVRSKPSSLRNAPLSLRTPSGRNPTSTHISLVFADTLVSGTEGGLTSEETLLRQLDGDLGGRQIGLRSRRGSSATLRTVRTRGGSIASMALVEEGENGQAIAGPSKSAPLDTSTLPSTLSRTSPAAPNLREDAPHMDRSRRTVNPKASSSWLRWNSPAPSFPRSKSPSLSDKGKGKGRVDGMPMSQPQSEPVQSITETSTPPDGLPEPTATVSAEPSISPPAASLKPPDTIHGVSSSPQRRSWFGWTTTQVETTSSIKDMPAPVKAPIADGTTSAVEDIKPADVSNTTTVEPQTVTKGPLQAETIAAPSHVDPGVGERRTSSTSEASARPNNEAKVRENGTEKQIEKSVPPSAGWGSYLWGTGKTAPPNDTAQTKAAGPKEASEVVADGQDETAAVVPIESPPTTATGLETGATSSSPLQEDPPQVTQVQENPGWGSYFYPFVTPKPPTAAPTAAQHKADVIEPASGPATEQPPLPAPSPEPPKLDGNASLAPPPSQPMSRIDNELGTLNPKSTPRDRQNSTASASGWLNYLAFRASQKKIANPSTTSIKSGKEKKRMSVEVGEEVMDFSTDPNFPLADELAKKDQSGKTKKAPDPKAQTLSTSKSSQALGVRQRKLSDTSSRSGTRTPVPASPKAPGKPPVPAKTPNSKGTVPATPALPNLIIPSFESTFSRPPRSLPPSYTQSGITGTTWRALGAVGNYVYGDKHSANDARGQRASRGVGDDLPRRVQTDDGWKSVKRIAIVGVHGWFPARMLNSVIGEPTGTSVKFASMMEQAVRGFFKERGVEAAGLRITPMPLEGEGTIEHRVDRLYNAYLGNAGWVNDLRRADAVFFAAHSQGCIVTTHLISRMIAQGHIRTPFNRDAAVRCEWAFGPIDIIPDTSRKRVPAADQKVAMLSMCGVHLGPLYSISTSSVIQPYLQWFENAAARELFEFQESSSAVSVAYQKALSMVLENGVKVLLLASLNDQVVPIYGASFSTATHPLLLRALFVDGASYAQSDFMTHLLSFAFMLRNAGINDQRLVEHLSEATAGSLTGLGHSSPYEDLGCYSLTVEYLFQSGPALPSAVRPGSRSPVIPLVSESFSAKEARNDYELPYLMRAIVDSPEINDLFPGELKALKNGIVAWKPVTKALKEVKRRLEPMANRHSPLSSSVTPSQSAVNTASTLKRD